MYLQTGDVLYKLTSEMPVAAKEIKGDIIHKGNNHYHRIEGSFQLYDDNGQMFILCLGNCKLTHDEHKTIEIPEGLYKKGIVLEYDHFLEESREVVD